MPTIFPEQTTTPPEKESNSDGQDIVEPYVGEKTSHAPTLSEDDQEEDNADSGDENEEEVVDDDAASPEENTDEYAEFDEEDFDDDFDDDFEEEVEGEYEIEDDEFADNVVDMPKIEKDDDDETSDKDA